MKPNCIDISTWQQNVDFAKVKASGVRAVIIRAGFGTTKDNQFENHYRGAKAAGLKIGAYWYSYAYSTAQAENEARACVSILSGKSFDLPVYYDMEEDDQMPLGKTTMTLMACRFLDTVKASGYRVGMYSSPSWFTDILDYDLLRSKYSIWLAHWASAHSRACDIWQYGYGTVSGVNGDCDCNIIENEAVIDGSEVPPAPVDPSYDAPDVSTVQKWLNSNYNTGLDVDGIYGRLTKAAHVMALQIELNHRGAELEVDGIFGPCTKSAVYNLSTGDSGNLVYILQGLLLCNGYGAGGFDGIFGAGTEAAVLAYQYQNGLDADGIAGRQTFERLCN